MTWTAELNSDSIDVLGKMERLEGQYNICYVCLIFHHLWWISSLAYRYGIVFVDADECFEGTHSCSNGSATCTNVDGSFRCRCASGYTGDGYSCNGKVSYVKLDSYFIHR